MITTDNEVILFTVEYLVKASLGSSSGMRPST